MALSDEFAKAFASTTKELHKEKKQREKDTARWLRSHRARRAAVPENTLKQAAFEVMPAAVAAASGNGAYRVSARTLYYQVRPRIQRYTEKPLKYDYFSQTLLTAYRDEVGPIRELYYDPRGEMVEPHTDTTLQLGTLAVAGYKLPQWTFDKILYVEKKGLQSILADAKFAERYDMAIAYGEGYAVEACRELLSRASWRSRFTILVLHDADPYGYEIARTLGEATRRMPSHSIEVVDLGLSVADAAEAGLEIEEFTRKKALPFGMVDRLTEQEQEWFVGDSEWGSAICTRVELNAFAAPDLVEYLDRQLEHAGVTAKIVPPDDVLTDRATEQHTETITTLIEDYLAERFQKAALLDTLIAQFPAAAAGLTEVVTDAHEADGATWWKTAVNEHVDHAVDEQHDSIRRRLAELITARLDADDTDPDGDR